MLRREWKRLKSSLYVPSFLTGRRENKQRPRRCRSWRGRSRLGGWFPCPDCCEKESSSSSGGCPECDGVTPLAFSVTLAGFTDNDGRCEDSTCDQLNGDYVVTRTGDPCIWEYTLPAEICFWQVLRVYTYNAGGGNYGISAILVRGALWGGWAKLYMGSKVDCDGLIAEVLPWHGTGGASWCFTETPKPTCEITAL